MDPNLKEVLEWVQGVVLKYPENFQEGSENREKLGNLVALLSSSKTLQQKIGEIGTLLPKKIANDLYAVEHLLTIASIPFVYRECEDKCPIVDVTKLTSFELLLLGNHLLDFSPMTGYVEPLLLVGDKELLGLLRKQTNDFVAASFVLTQIEQEAFQLEIDVYDPVALHEFQEEKKQELAQKDVFDFATINRLEPLQEEVRKVF